MTEDNNVHEEFLLIEKKIEDMIMYLHIMIKQFPKEEKYIFASKIREISYHLYELAITTNKKFHKKTTLSEMNIKHQLLRRLVHLAYKLKYINNQKFRVAQLHIDEVGRLLGNWIKTVTQ